MSIDYNMDFKYQRRTLSTCCRHLARPRRRRRRRRCHRHRRRAQAFTSNTASYDNHAKFVYSYDEYGAPLGGPSDTRGPL